MSDLTIWSDSANGFEAHNVELNFKRYYEEGLRKKGKTISRQAFYDNCDSIKYRLSGLISLDFFKNLTSPQSACEAAVLVPSLTIPMMTKKMRAETMEPLLRRLCRWRMRELSESDVNDFVKQLVATVLSYSSFWGEESQDIKKQTARSVVGAIGKNVTKLYRQAVPVDLYNIKRVFGGMHQAIGIYVINRIYLENTHQESVTEALYHYKVVLTKRLEDILGLFAASFS